MHFVLSNRGQNPTSRYGIHSN